MSQSGSTGRRKFGMQMLESEVAMHVCLCGGSTCSVGKYIWFSFHLLCLGNKQGEEISGRATHLVNCPQPTSCSCAFTATQSWDTQIRNCLQMFPGAAIVFFPVAEQTYCFMVCMKVLCETRVSTGLEGFMNAEDTGGLKRSSLPLKSSNIRTFCNSLPKSHALWKRNSLSVSWYIFQHHHPPKKPNKTQNNNTKQPQKAELDAGRY